MYMYTTSCTITSSVSCSLIDMLPGDDLYMLWMVFILYYLHSFKVDGINNSMDDEGEVSGEERDLHVVGNQLNSFNLAIPEIVTGIDMHVYCNCAQILVHLTILCVCMYVYTYVHVHT